MADQQQKERITTKLDKKLEGAIDLNEVLQETANIIVNEKYCNSSVVFINNPKQKKIFSKKFANNTMNKYVTSFLNKPFDSLSVDYKVKDNLIVKTVIERKFYHSNKLIDFIRPITSDSMAKLLQSLGKANCITSFPIIMHDETLGAIMLTDTKHREFEKDKDFLKEYAQTAANYITKFNA